MVRTIPAAEAASNRPMIATIAGQQGAGKTTLGASFPKPLIVRIEDGVRSIADMPGVLVSERIDSRKACVAFLSELASDPGEIQTVVFDSVSALEPMVEESIIKESGSRTLNQALGGYGAGQNALADWFKWFRWECDDLRKKGLNVVFLSHITIMTANPPDMESYTYSALDMREKCARPFINDVDVVGILRPIVETESVDGDRRIAVSNLKRELLVSTHPGHVGKNRYGITEPLAVSERTNPLAQWLPSTAKATEPHGEF